MSVFCKCVSALSLIRFCSEELGVGQRMAEKFLARAREIIKADHSVERPDFLGT